MRTGRQWNNLWRLACILSVLSGAVARHAVGQDESASAAPDTVYRHGDAAPIRGEIVRIDAAGIALRDRAKGDDATYTVSLHEVREVTSVRHADAWRRIRPDADRLWRAVARLRRGDPGLAEPLFDQLFDRYHEAEHETALVVAEGALRCRLARAANEQAVVPWLDVVRLRRANVETTAFSDLPNVLDNDTMLCPQLPPAWPGGNRPMRLRAALQEYDASDDPVVAEFAALYRLFAELALGESVERPASEPPRHAGVAMMHEILALRLGDVDPSSVSRAERKAAEWPAWAQAWMRFHLGEALLARTDRPSRDLGLVQLAHVPANHHFAQPYLAGLALASMARGLEARGDADHAGALRRLVYERYPGHPAGEMTVREPISERKTRP